MSAEGSSDKSRVCLGFIAGAHGLAGAVRLKLQTDDLAAVSTYGPLEDEAGERRFEFLEIRPGKGGLIGRLKGVSDRRAAEALKGTELFVARAKLPATDSDEWYHADLIGLEVVDVAGESVGAVIAVQNFGAGDLLEIKPTQGKASILVPFRTESVPQVDIAGGRITIDPPEGLLDP